MSEVGKEFQVQQNSRSNNRLDGMEPGRAEALYLEVASQMRPNDKRQSDVVRGWQDGRYVFLHGYRGPDDEALGCVTTDFFDTDDSRKVVEHWNVTSQFVGPNPSGRTQTDGATMITDLGRTEENKAVVEAMLKDCLFPGAQPNNIEMYFAEDYLQHNPSVGDGLEVVRQLTAGATRKLVYDEIVLVVGRGNFVATLCRANWEGSPLVQVDIVRLESGKIVEHWDNVQSAFEADGSVGDF